MSMLRAQAWLDLWRRHLAVLSQAWRERALTDAKRLRPHELEFLPAALALQETPVSPAPRVAALAIAAFALGALGLSVFGKLDIVASAEGKLVPSDRTKLVQPFETARVKAIHVRDGQSVKAGEVLLEFDPTTARADRDRLEGQLDEARLQVARSEALLRALDAPAGAPLAFERLEGVSEASYQTALRLLRGQYEEHSTRLEHNDAELAQRQAELASVQDEIPRLAALVPLTRQRADDFQRMVEVNAAPAHAYLEQRERALQQDALLATRRSRAVELDAAIREAKTRRSTLAAEMRRTALDGLLDGEQRAAAIRQELVKAEARAELTVLTAPVDGTVQQLAVHTLGGVVTPAQPLAVIVPADNPIEVEAFIENKDIGFVRVGQEAEVKIVTFPYARYGTVRARVLSVSHDAISDEQRGLVYSARVELERTALEVDGANVQLTPGMAVSVEIQTGRRRVIEYFLNPVIERARESLRER